MKLLLVFILLIFLISGLFFANQFNVSSLDENMKVKYKQLAVEYVAKDPVINNSLILSKSWDNFNLGSDVKTRFYPEWLSQQSALIYISGSNQLTVEWQGLPGCVLNKMWELGYKPDLTDSEGKACQTWWQVRVVLNINSELVEEFEVKEVGYEEGV